MLPHSLRLYGKPGRLRENRRNIEIYWEHKQVGKTAPLILKPALMMFSECIRFIEASQVDLGMEIGSAITQRMVGRHDRVPRLGNEWESSLCHLIYTLELDQDFRLLTIYSLGNTLLCTALFSFDLFQPHRFKSLSSTVSELFCP